MYYVLAMNERMISFCSTGIRNVEIIHKIRNLFATSMGMSRAREGVSMACMNSHSKSASKASFVLCAGSPYIHSYIKQFNHEDNVNNYPYIHTYIHTEDRRIHIYTHTNTYIHT